MMQKTWLLLRVLIVAVVFLAARPTEKAQAFCGFCNGGMCWGGNGGVCSDDLPDPPFCQSVPGKSCPNQN
jgi:hypothetical protein